jgi:LysM repeat protein
MTDSFERGSHARAVFAGLLPSSDSGGARHLEAVPTGFRSRRWRSGAMFTLPIVLAGAMSLTLVAPSDSASAAPKRPTKPKSELTKTPREILLTAARSSTSVATAPTRYTVRPGDTVSSIAGRYGVSTASVLALNGLSRKSLIFPGQVLRLSASAAQSAPVPAGPAAAAAGGRYTIVRGDTISAIAARFGVSTQSVLTANGLGWSSLIYPGQTIAIPAGSHRSEAVSTAPASTPAPPATVSYTIAPGDTLSAIAARFRTTTAAIMAANSMGGSTIIYSGRTLVIPTGSTAPALAITTVSAITPSAPLTDEMAANARLIIRTGQRLGVPDRGIVVALAAAMQESGLRNLSYGDRDSVGLFQQRPSTGWGTRAQLLDPEHATELFYGGPRNPNRGRTRGLLDIHGWQSMTIAQAAQAVQISAYPGAYAKWETSAWTWLARYR